MKVIEYIKLYNYLTHVESFHVWESIRTISKVRKMDVEILSAMQRWIYYRVEPEKLICNGVSYYELVNEEEMRPIQAFLMLDWIKRDPIAAMRYMESERLRSPIQPLSDKEAETVTEAIVKLKDKGIIVDDGKMAEGIEDLTPEERLDIEF